MVGLVPLPSLALALGEIRTFCLPGGGSWCGEGVIVHPLPSQHLQPALGQSVPIRAEV